MAPQRPDQTAGSLVPDLVELPTPERTDLALKYWLEQGGEKSKKSKTKIVKEYGVNPRTFIDRCNGHTSRAQAHQYRQRLLPGEEESIVKWAFLLVAWGWPPRIE